MSKTDLEGLYNSTGSISALARHLGVAYSKARRCLLEAGIELRRTGFCSPKSVSRRGPDHHKWKGGTSRHSDGYIYEYAPDHPAISDHEHPYVLQHRLVMERHLGRYLEPNEIVHHKNGDKADNRLENLELTALSPHVKHHKQTAPRDEKGRFSLPS